MAIRGPETGHSLSAIFPVSPSPTVHCGKEQSGTDFGKRGALDGSGRDRPGDCPAMGSFSGTTQRRAISAIAVCIGQS